MAIRMSFVECTCRCVSRGYVFLHKIILFTSYVRHSIYWREEKANEITVHNWVCITRCVLNGLNYGGLMMFDSCHFSARHSLLLSMICMDSLQFSFHLTIGRGSLIRCFWGES